MGTIDLPPHWSILSLLLSLLQSQLDRARDDLLTASIQSPLYGVIQSVRATLEEAKKLYVFQLNILLCTSYMYGSCSELIEFLKHAK